MASPTPPRYPLLWFLNTTYPPVPHPLCLLHIPAATFWFVHFYTHTLCPLCCYLVDGLLRVITFSGFTAWQLCLEQLVLWMACLPSSKHCPLLDIAGFAFAHICLYYRLLSTPHYCCQLTIFHFQWVSSTNALFLFTPRTIWISPLFILFSHLALPAWYCRWRWHAAYVVARHMALPLAFLPIPFPSSEGSGLAYYLFVAVCFPPPVGSYAGEPRSFMRGVVLGQFIRALYAQFALLGLPRSLPACLLRYTTRFGFCGLPPPPHLCVPSIMPLHHICHSNVRIPHQLSPTLPSPRAGWFLTWHLLPTQGFRFSPCGLPHVAPRTLPPPFAARLQAAFYLRTFTTYPPCWHYHPSCARTTFPAFLLFVVPYPVLLPIPVDGMFVAMPSLCPGFGHYRQHAARLTAWHLGLVSLPHHVCILYQHFHVAGLGVTCRAPAVPVHGFWICLLTLPLHAALFCHSIRHIWFLPRSAPHTLCAHGPVLSFPLI